MAQRSSGQGQAQPGKRFGLVHWIILAVIATIILVGLALLITWLTIKPKRLVYTVEAASAKNYHLASNDHLSATFDLSIGAYNSDKRVAIRYRKIHVSMVHRNQTVTFGELQPFHQPPRNESLINSTLVAHGVALSQYNARDLRGEAKLGSIEVDVYFKAGIRYKIGIWKSRKRSIRASCPSVMINVTSPPSPHGDNFNRVYCQVHY